MSAGYSGTPLVKKLGLKPQWRAIAIEAPNNYLDLLGELPESFEFVEKKSGTFNFIHIFSTRQSDLEAELETMKPLLHSSGMIWISWPKKSSGLKTDLSGNLVREIGLAKGLVDVKVCAVDEIWSGHKFVYRLKDR